MSMQENLDLEKLKFPIGPFQWDGEWGPEYKKQWISSIRTLPDRLHDAVEGLSDEQLDTPYRPGGWTVRQVVHHLADSHMNSLTRFKLALTEPEPTIKPYREDLWAELADSRHYPVASSLAILEGLHRRWAALLEALSEEDYLRTFYHPESESLIPLRRALATYAWHGTHHLTQILAIKERSGW